MSGFAETKNENAGNNSKEKLISFVKQ